jgi:hypothetical protein
MRIESQRLAAHRVIDRPRLFSWSSLCREYYRSLTSHLSSSWAPLAGSIAGEKLGLARASRRTLCLTRATKIAATPFLTDKRNNDRGAFCRVMPGPVSLTVELGSPSLYG